jgi:hypothetical protein
VSADFRSKLAASISAATSKLDGDEQAVLDAAAAAREKTRLENERFATIKSRAQRFKHNKLEPLFREVLQQIGEQGFAVGGGYEEYDGENHGIIGCTVETAGDWVIRAVIMYGLEKSTVRVEAQTAKGQCCSASATFDENTSLDWFESQVVEAAGKLVESGGLPSRSKPVTYNGRAY